MKRILFAFLVCLLTQSAMAQCTASFTTASAPQNNNLLRVALNNTSVPPTGPTKFTLFTLNWGDGSPVNNVWTGNSYHNYSTQGVYPITLIMTTFDSTSSGLVFYCSDTARDSAHVFYTPCATSISLTNNSPNVTVTATTPAGTPSMTYTWAWGDATPNGSGSPANHTYTTTGNKTITLTATNGTCSYTNNYVVNITSTCANAISAFNFGISGTGATFTALSGNVTGTTKRYDWYFGDGNFSLNNTSNTKSHTYATSGNYNAKLITKWYDSTTMNLKCTDSNSKTITISNIISGYIGLDSNTTNKVDSPDYKVWLIVFDSATNILSAVDSIIVNATNSYSYPYQFLNKAAGTYRVKAKLLNGPTSGTGWVPTYHISSLMWNTATTFNHAGGATTSKNILMQAGTVTGGPGFVGGNVSAGANKGSASGIEGMTILLLDANGNFVTSATTDVNGNYTFTQLAPAAYTVHPEDLGFTTTPVSLTIVNNKPTILGINFERSISNQTITPAATAITNINNVSVGFAVYPNPAKDKISVKWNNTLTTTADINITDVTGKTVFTATSVNSDTELSLSNLQKGLYFITISADNVLETKKLLLQ